MNHLFTLPTTARIASFAFAVLCTLSILAGIGQLACVDDGAAQLARASAPQHG